MTKYEMRKVNDLGSFEANENTVVMYRPKRAMSEKELKILSAVVKSEGKKVGIKTMLVPFGADFEIVEEAADITDPGTIVTENAENETENGTIIPENEIVVQNPGKVVELTEEEIRAKAKDLGITSTHNKGLEKLKKEIEEKEADKE